MGFKDLFFVNENEDKKQESVNDTQNTFQNKFPSGPETKSVEVASTNQTATQTTEATPDNPSCVPHLEKIMELYEKGFDGLDMDGYDFYEYFKMVVEAGINNGAVYNMAFTMGKTMGATKESLIEQSQYYIDEINKVHQHYVDSGVIKKETAIKAKTDEENTLRAELLDINSEIERLMKLKAEKESMLSTIDSKYSPQIMDIDCKLMANDMARDKIVNTITTVVNGIKSNVN